jgi:hypothetical protein
MSAENIFFDMSGKNGWIEYHTQVFIFWGKKKNYESKIHQPSHNKKITNRKLINFHMAGRITGGGESLSPLAIAQS